MSQPSSFAAPAADRYTMALCHVPSASMFDDAGRVDAALLARNLALAEDMIARAAGDHGARLIVLPQFGLSGFAPLSPAQWAKAAMTVPGPEIDRIGAAARQAGAYVVVQLPELHAAFPGRYFLSAVIIDPDGAPILTYRKNYTLSSRTSPNDVLDRFLTTFGAAALLPVVRTPLGTLGLTIGAEPHWPEPIRALALKGAEVVLNPVAASPALDYMGRAAAPLVRPVRAFENMLFLGMANIAGASGAPRSEAWDFEGRPIGIAAGPHGEFTMAEIDLAAQRAARARPAANFLAQLQPQIHPELGTTECWARNAFADAPAFPAALTEAEALAWARLQREWQSA